MTNKNGNLIFDNDLKYSQIFKKIAKRKKLNLFSIGKSDSLNLAVSTGIILYESIRKNPN